MVLGEGALANFRSKSKQRDSSSSLQVLAVLFIYTGLPANHCCCFFFFTWIIVYALSRHRGIDFSFPSSSFIIFLLGFQPLYHALDASWNAGVQITYTPDNVITQFKLNQSRLLSRCGHHTMCSSR